MIGKPYPMNLLLSDAVQKMHENARPLYSVTFRVLDVTEIILSVFAQILSGKTFADLRPTV
jgi:hypothetical protein